MLALALRGLPLRLTAPGWVLVVAVGATHATNALGSPTAPLSLATALALAGWGARLGGPVGRLLLVTYGLGAALLLGHLAGTGGLAA